MNTLFINEKLADLFVLDRDIFEIPSDEIQNIKVEITMVDGNIVLRRA